MDIDAFFDQVEARLIASQARQPYEFRKSSLSAIEAFLKTKRVKSRGYTEAEIAQAEADMGLFFPRVFRTWLARFGAEAGPLFRFDMPSPLEDIVESYCEYHKSGKSALPENSFTFMLSQGPWEFFTLGERETARLDAPVFSVDDRFKTMEVAESFQQFLEGDVADVERDADRREQAKPFVLELDDDGRVLRRRRALPLWLSPRRWRIR